MAGFVYIPARRDSLLGGRPGAGEGQRAAQKKSAPATEKAKRAARPRDSVGPSDPKTAANPAARIKAPKGFRVELLYSVPRETQGSWVNLTVDPKGRLIVSDQYGKLYRVTPPPVGEKADGDQGRADRRRDRRGPRAALGVR